VAVEAGQARAWLVGPFVCEYEVEVTEDERGQRLLWFGFDQLDAQLWCTAGEDR
jgi:hypothetical protein